MSDRAEKLLQASAIHEPLIGSIERGDTLFVLTSGTLLYQDSGGTRRVTLRDLTRIHSDQDGLLRVETPAGTALTASLLGFDPVDVQTFFGQVRDTTARVKQAATAAVAPPAAQAAPPQTPPTPAAMPPRPAPSAPAASPAAPQGFQESVKVVSPAARDPQVPKVPTLIIPPPAPATEIRNPTLVTTPVPQRNPSLITPPSTPPAPTTPSVIPPAAPSRNPTLITAPAAVPPRNPTPAPVAPPPAPVKTPSAPAAVVPPPAPVSAPKAAEPVADKADKIQPEKDSSKRPPAVPQSAVGTLATLAAHAESVRAWVGRLRFLAVLMLLAAFALAFLQMQAGQGLAGIWVLIAGGMSAVGLLALADLTKLLVSLASAVSAEGGVMDVD